MSSCLHSFPDLKLIPFLVLITTHLLAVLAIIAGLLAPLFAPSRTFAALPSNELWRENLVNNVVGFGKNTTGGKGGTLCTVSNLNNSGTGSLRACAMASGAQWIVFAVSGTITLSTEIYLTSNKTIDGRGQNVVISGAGLILEGVSNVIIENLTVQNTSGDGIAVRNGSTNVWIDHITFGASGDEQLYVGSNGGAATPGVTISWNHFLYFPGKGSGAFLISTETTPQDMNTTVTAHHNYYDRTEVRNPYAMQAMMHSFNNYCYQNEIGTQVQVNGRYYSENDIFEGPYAGSYPRVKVIDDYGTVLNVKVLNPWSVRGDETYEQRNPNTIFNPASFYPYTPETANAALRTAIINGAGRQNVSPPTTVAAPTNLRVIDP